MTPKIDSINRIDELGNRNLNQYDLFLLDYNLEDENKKTGADLISSIRSKDIYTVVIFYSSDDSLHQEIASKKLDGVYVCNRRDDEHLKEKIKVVSNLSVKRLLDPNSLRGLFLTSVAEIESKMDQLLPLIHDQLVKACAGKVQVRDYVKSTLKELLKREEQKIRKLDGSSLDFSSMVGERCLLDLSRKARLLYSMISNQYMKDKYSPVFSKHRMEISDSFIEVFDSEIRLFRNDLAHEPAERLFGHMRDRVSRLGEYPDRKQQILGERSLLDFQDESFKYLHYIVSLEREYNAFMDDLLEVTKSL